MRKITLLIAIALSAAVMFGAPSPAAAEQHEATKPDSTRMNKEMTKEGTAEQQGESKSDREITRKIRRAVVKDKSLSQYAHNVKIITRDGQVTLKGPVRSVKEKTAIGKAAAQVAGKAMVSNKLEIAPEK